MASSLFSLRARQSSRTTSLQVLFGLPLGHGPSTSYSIHFFTQTSSSFRSTCPYQHTLFCCNTNDMSSIPSLSLSSLLGILSFNLTPHIHLTILISARWSATTFSFLTGQVSLPCSMLLRTQLLYNLPLIIKDTSLLDVSIHINTAYFKLTFKNISNGMCSCLDDKCVFTVWKLECWCLSHFVDTTTEYTTLRFHCLQYHKQSDIRLNSLIKHKWFPVSGFTADFHYITFSCLLYGFIQMMTDFVIDMQCYGHTAEVAVHPHCVLLTNSNV